MKTASSKYCPQIILKETEIDCLPLYYVFLTRINILSHFNKSPFTTVEVNTSYPVLISQENHTL